jgi:hypothetical protein
MDRGKGHRLAMQEILNRGLVRKSYAWSDSVSAISGFGLPQEIIV